MAFNQTFQSKPISTNYNTYRSAYVKFIVMHTAGAVGDAGTNQRWFSKPTTKASAHYTIELDGSTHQHVLEGHTAWHAGSSWWNHRSIGIEHQDNGEYDNPNTYTRSQVYASAALVFDICQRYNLPINRKTVRKHNEIVTNRACPGKLPIDEIIKIANSYMDQLESKKQEVADLREFIAGIQQQIVELDTAIIEKDERLQKLTEDNKKLQATIDSLPKSGIVKFVQQIISSIF